MKQLLLRKQMLTTNSHMNGKSKRTSLFSASLQYLKLLTKSVSADSKTGSGTHMPSEHNSTKDQKQMVASASDILV